MSRSLISKLEQGHPGIALRTRFHVAAVLGADLRLTAFEGAGALIRDARQAGIVDGLLRARDPRWKPTVEAAVPGPGRRSVDLRLDSPAHIVLIEVETRLSSLEEIIRELHAKRQAFYDAAPGTATSPFTSSSRYPRRATTARSFGPIRSLIRAAFPGDVDPDKSRSCGRVQGVAR